MTKEIHMQPGKFCLVDDEDYDWLNKHRWHMSGSGYAIRAIYDPATQRQTFSFMHREILNAPKGLRGDHINHIKHDNRRVNLRLATELDNRHNRPAEKINTTGFKGVTYDTKARNVARYKARITVNGKMKHLGSFLQAKQAALAYDSAARLYYGEFAYVNFPDIVLTLEEALSVARKPRLVFKANGDFASY